MTWPGIVRYLTIIMLNSDEMAHLTLRFCYILHSKCSRRILEPSSFEPNGRNYTLRCSNCGLRERKRAHGMRPRMNWKCKNKPSTFNVRYFVCL